MDWDTAFSLANEQPEIDLSNNLALEEIDDEEEKEVKRDQNVCPCGGIIILEENVGVCNLCGLEKLFYTEDFNEEGITNSSTVKIVSTSKNRSLIASIQRSITIATSNYTATQKYNTTKELIRLIRNIDVPEFIMHQAVTMYNQIKESHHVFRKNTKNGVIAICIVTICYKESIWRTPNEICAQLNLPKKFYPTCMRMLNSYNERNEINIDFSINTTTCYVKRYMELLDIPLYYEDFIMSIINTAIDNRLHVIYSSKDDTKAVGAIYALVIAIDKLAHLVDKIESICGLTRTTYIKYYSMIHEYFRLFVPMYVEYQIPMPAAWREPISLTANGLGNLKTKNKAPEVQFIRYIEAKRQKKLAATARSLERCVGVA